MNAALDIEKIYAKYHDELVSVAVEKFGVPAEDAEGLLKDVLLSLKQSKEKIDNIRVWLVGAMCDASRHYLREKGLLQETFTIDPSDSAGGNPAELAEPVTVRAFVESLPPLDRKILRMRYYEACPAADIARELGVTTKYVQKFLDRAAKRVTGRYPPKGRSLTAAERDALLVYKDYIEAYRKVG